MNSEPVKNETRENPHASQELYGNLLNKCTSKFDRKGWNLDGAS